MRNTLVTYWGLIALLGAQSVPAMGMPPATLPQNISSEKTTVKSTPGLRIIRSFEPVPEFSISNANVIEADPAYFKFAAISAKKAAGKSKITVKALRRLMPEPSLMINAGFFDPPSGALIGEFVEDGERPESIIFPENENLDRVFIARNDGSVDVLDGIEKLSEEELLTVRYAVAGKSAWPGHSDATNRSAICITSSGKVLIAALYPVRTLNALFAYMASEGCLRDKIVNLDGGGSTQMSYRTDGQEWDLGWERKGNGVPECHITGDNQDNRCYRPVATFIAVQPK